MEEIRIEEINIQEPQVVIHLGDVNFLEKSVLNYGILSPPILFKNRGALEIVDGWARLKIANAHSMEKVKCQILQCSLKEAFLFHLSLNIKWRGFSEGEKLLIFKRFMNYGFREEEVIEGWEKISGERISRDFLIECLKLYDEIPEVVEFLHSGKINLTTAKELLKFPENWRKEILSFLRKVKGSTGEWINLLRLLEEGLYSGRIKEIEWLKNFSDLKSPLKKTFELSHPYTARCMEEIARILEELPPNFCLKLPEYLCGNNAELKINFNILEDLKIPENLNEVLSKVRKIVVEGVDL